MASETFDTSRFVDALRLADLLLASIRDWICMRRRTIHKLRNVANELNNIKKNVNITNMAGSSVSVVGGSMVVAALFAVAAPIAVPLVLCGTITSLVGGLTSYVGENIGTRVSQNKLEEAQKMMDQEKEVLEKIEKITKELEMKTNEIVETMENLSRESLLCALLIANQCGQHLFDSSSNTLTFSGYRGILNTAVKITQSFKPLQYLLTKIVAYTSVKGAVKVAKNIVLRGIVIRGIASGAVMIWDIAELVIAAVDINKGSTTGAASDLFKLADEYEVQMNESLKFLTELEQCAADFQIKEMFRNISIKGHATDAEVRYVVEYLEKHASDSFKCEFERLLSNSDKERYVLGLSLVFLSLEKQIIEHVNKSDRRNDIEITIIGHGGIQLPKVSGGFHYLNDAVKSVTLYEPWGCAIDASVVYGIMTGTLQLQNVRYTGDVYKVMQNRILPIQYVDEWNILPNEYGLDIIPTVELTPVTEGEAALEELRQIMEHFSFRTRGLVIPYYPGFNRYILPFKAIPLFVICQAVGLICAMIDIRCDIHIACCLSVQHTNIIQDLENVQVVNVHQYLTVLHQRPPHMMTNLVFPEALHTRLAPLNRFL